MGIELSEEVVTGRLAGLLDEPRFRLGVERLAGDPFFLAFFLVSVSQGEGLGEAAVGMIGQDELAGRIRDLQRQEAEERGHKEQTIEAARALFPEYFQDGEYRHRGALEGQTYYLSVLEQNRERLRLRGRYSRLNQYLTTTFAYEVMVVLLYRAVAEAVRTGGLPPDVRERVSDVLDRILAEEETHLSVVGQHNELLQTDRGGLSDEAKTMLDALEKLEPDDYLAPAELAVSEVVVMTRRYADPGRRARIEAAG